MELYAFVLISRQAMAVLSKLAKSAENTENAADSVDNGAFQVFRINKLFLSDEIPVRDEFIQRITKMRAELGHVDFQRSAEDARKEINQYVGGPHEWQGARMLFRRKHHPANLNGAGQRHLLSSKVNQQSLCVLLILSCSVLSIINDKHCFSSARDLSCLQLNFRLQTLFEIGLRTIQNS